MMRARFVEVLAGLAALGALAYGGTALASGGSDGSSASGPGADRAREAALAHVGGGTANAVERDSENGATWEVEVTKKDGATVDVRLDASYEVLVVEGDSEETSEAGESEEGESEQQGDDGPGGHANDPADPNAEHEVEGSE